MIKDKIPHYTLGLRQVKLSSECAHTIKKITNSQVFLSTDPSTVAAFPSGCCKNCLSKLAQLWFPRLCNANSTYHLAGMCRI